MKNQVEGLYAIVRSVVTVPHFPTGCDKPFKYCNWSEGIKWVRKIILEAVWVTDLQDVGEMDQES